MKRFNEWMEKQEQQAERNFPGFGQKSTKAATGLMKIVWLIILIMWIVATLGLFVVFWPLGIVALITMGLPIKLVKMSFAKQEAA